MVLQLPLHNLRELLSRLSKSRRARGASSVFISTSIANVLAYIYTIVMGRFLGPAQYGLLVVVISAVSIFSIPSQALNTLGMNFASQYVNTNQYGYVKQYVYRVHRKILPLILIILIISLLFSSIIMNLLKLPSAQYILWIVLFSGLSYLAIVTFSVIQGLQMFKIFTILIILSSLLKLMIGVIGVILVPSAKVASSGLFFALLITYGYSVWIVKNLKGKKYKKQIDTRRLKKIALPSLLTFASLTLLTYQDVLVVKRYFLDIDVGYYGALTTLGRIPFFFSVSIIGTLYPILSEAHIQKKHFQRWAAFCLITSFFICLIIEGCYLLFPRFFILTLYGENYLPIASLLGFIGIQNLFYSLSYVTSMILLAQNANDSWVLQLLAASLHLALLIRLSHSLFAVIFIGIFVNVLLLIMLISYYITQNGLTKKIYHRFN